MSYKLYHVSQRNPKIFSIVYNPLEFRILSHTLILVLPLNQWYRSQVSHMAWYCSRLSDTDKPGIVAIATKDTALELTTMQVITHLDLSSFSASCQQAALRISSTYMYVYSSKITVKDQSSYT